MEKKKTRGLRWEKREGYFENIKKGGGVRAKNLVLNSKGLQRNPQKWTSWVL